MTEHYLPHPSHFLLTSLHWTETTSERRRCESWLWLTGDPGMSKMWRIWSLSEKKGGYAGKNKQLIFHIKEQEKLRVDTTCAPEHFTSHVVILGGKFAAGGTKVWSETVQRKGKSFKVVGKAKKKWFTRLRTIKSTAGKITWKEDQCSSK